MCNQGITRISVLGVLITLSVLLASAQVEQHLYTFPSPGKQVDVDEIEHGVVYRAVLKTTGSPDSSVYNLFIPAGVDTIRGVFIHQHGCGMEGRGVSTAYDVQYQAFAKKWNLAIVGPDLYYQAGCYEWRDPESGSGPSLLAALERIGKASDHTELIDSPWLLWGHSGGGHWVLGMMKDYPERILAAFCYSPAFDPQWEYPDDALKIPVMIRHAGANDSNSPDGKCWETAVNTFHKLRSAGGLASIAYTPYQNHNYSFVRYMAIPFYESVLAKRLPRGKSASYKAMAAIDATEGWLGDSLSLNTYPYSAYADDPLSLSWLPDSGVAAKWKEYVITGSVVDRTPPPPPTTFTVKRLHNVAVELRWQADADIESGIKHFNIYNGNQWIARFPEHGVYQHFDTNGDDAIPMSGLPELKAVVMVPMGADANITISTVNHFDLESPRSVFTFPAAVLYDKAIGDKGNYPELIADGVDMQFTKNGLQVTGHDGVIKLNYYYALAERLVRYHVRFSADSKAVFQSDKGDFKAYVDVPNKRISIGTDPVVEKTVGFLDAAHDYTVEVHRDYQTSKIRIVDLNTGDVAELDATMDGTGGVGAGAVGTGFFVGRQYDYYCFGLVEGTALLVKQISVLANESDLTLLIYGDSITEPEGYFPTADFPQAWTQLIMQNMAGKAMTSGRGGTTINELMERIKNELPFLKAKYVMVTIGTNGGNTEENLSALVEYIQSQGSIPILNNIPCNESGTHIAVNAMIAQVRQKYGIKGCEFDLATSLHHDGVEVDKTTMYFENYDWGDIYHHPNVKGSLQMYTRTLSDVPEIYE